MATPTETGREPQEESSNAGGKPGLRKPVFTKVDLLKPGTGGHTLTVKVLNSIAVPPKGRPVSHHLRQSGIAECRIGDDTGSIIFTSRNDQVGTGKEVELTGALSDLLWDDIVAGPVTLRIPDSYGAR